MLNLTPLHILIESEAIKGIDRLACKQGHNHIKTEHTSIWLEAMANTPALQMPSDKIPPTYRFDRNFEVNIPNREDWSNGILPPDNIIYTDGTVIIKSAGAGIYSETLHIRSVNTRLFSSQRSRLFQPAAKKS